MNFLETLAREWYEYNGYFCRTNIRFGALAHGGHMGEMDVVAYHPKTKEFIHLECSTDSWSWEKKKEVFTRKFKNAQSFYDEKFPFEKEKVRKIAITAFQYPKHNAEQKMNFGNRVEIIIVPDFITKIALELSKKDPWKIGINESSYPLLRSIQYGTFYLLREIKREEKRNKK